MKYVILLLCVCLLLPGVVTGESLQLQVEGVEEGLSEAVKAALVLPSPLLNAEKINRRWLRNYQKQIPQRVREALEPYGYFLSEASSSLEQPQPGELQLIVQVTPGPPQRVTELQLDLQGPLVEQPELASQLPPFPLQVGDVLRQDQYEQGKSKRLQAVVDLGFLDASYSRHQILVHRREGRAEIRLSLDSGPRYHFGETLFQGADDYPERFLRRYLAYQKGAVFNYTELGQTQINLQNSDLFRNINVSPQTSAATPGVMPVQVELHPAPRHQLRPGIGYGTDTGARFSLHYRNLNLLQRGHELQGDLLLAQRRQSLVSNYIIPDMRRADSQTNLRVGFDREDTDSYLSRKLFSEAEYQRTFGSGLVGSLYLRLIQEYSLIGSDQTRSQLLIPGTRITWRKVDDVLDPRRGVLLRMELLGASRDLLSDTSLVQLKGDMLSLWPLPADLTLMLRLQGGSTWQDDPISDLPASLRFFAGGDGSVRGYGYQTLGPKDAAGEVIGGKNLLVANLELERRFNENWGGAVFYDIGNAFDSFSQYELEQGAGIGVRRYTPVGSLRLDLARQVGTPKESFRVHLSVGFGW